MSVLLAATVASDSGIATDHLRSQLVAESDAAVPGQTVRLGLLFEHDPHWHTYWANPGDSGLPTRLRWTLPAEVSAGEVQWPMPTRFALGDIVNYGYEGRTLLPVALRVPNDFGGDTLKIGLEARWLICQEECIPGKATYTLQLPIAKQATADPRWLADFQRADRAQPSALQGSAQLRRDGEDVVLSITSNQTDLESAEWFPLTPKLVANSASHAWTATAEGGELRWPQSEFFAGLPVESEWWLRLGQTALRITARTSN